MKKIIRLDALVSIRDMSVRGDPPPRGQHPAGRKIILTHCLVKMRAKILIFSLNVSFCRTPPLKVNHEVIGPFMTSQYATLRKWVLHVNGSLTGTLCFPMFFYLFLAHLSR